uniref:Protein NO VEIN C-terminal domain-containing protein n=1 Tax=Aplanochytrium stocchinoi TaxID=215587 RepID=A0A7S3LTJ6_9STRA|mmetsp:Transcript_2361/g.3200  ORF Transcript_2361/g.3200 Transcript_2361/m.3200 type:complete len:508 (-) Transcript_2361:628-2151(-)|eukprot:CAMPEP_0204871660 /NCGR_PEP_ID=MMETSP1348-20121228/36114_1 /ASSEMBLY_ACC=CAM_ASM_000700 /TAXON_ID=215587 /ORGANISM="Aplanochytrium stocchinoi, Strain GSBS06" /LENGTH=507 /DNA_ID=CAMNT_0052026101 /DNA_START=135 /DNA_END=1661 /DNA_ORIENTATION=+
MSETATNCVVVNCVRTLISEGKFPNLDNCKFYLRNFSNRQCYEGVPAFQYLLEINQRIHIFVTSFLTTRPIVTLLDLEAELCAFLHSLCVPSFTHSFGSQNPEEIDIDNDSSVETWSKENFDWFGLGHLINYPPVLKLFKSVSKQPLRETDILKIFDSFEGLAADFESHIREKYSVRDIHAELNVSIDSNGLKQYRVALIHIHQAQYRKRKGENTVSVELTKKQKKTTIYKSQRLKLPETRTHVCAVLSKCQKILDSSYPPSFTKLYNIVNNLDISWESCSEVITEYCMLHLGSSSYRQSKFEPAENPIIIEENTNFQDREEKDNIDNSVLISQCSQAVSSHIKNVVERSMPHLSSVGMVSVVPNSELRGLFPSSACRGSRNSDSTGKWGESLVYQYLLNKHPEAEVCWMNKDKESLAAYDIKLMFKGENNLQSTRFIEVKTTRFSDKNVFELSFNEFTFMSSQGGQINFDIYRVYNAGDSTRVTITAVRNAYSKLKNHGLKLCLAI